jgi:hypothetical protein
LLQIDPQVINDLIDVPVLPISASPFSEDMEPPTLEQLREYFHAHPQGHVRAHAHIKIGGFSPPHHLLAKIVLVFVLATFCWTKSLLCNVAAFIKKIL